MTLATQITTTFSLVLKLDGQLVEAADDGYLGEIAGSSFSLLLSDVPSTMTPIRVDGSKNIALMKNEGSEDQSLFKKKIAVQPGVEGCLTTKYPHNVVRIIEIENDLMRLHEIAVVSQNGHFYVTQQVAYEERMFQLDGSLKIERFDSWPQMTNVLTELVGDDVSTLPEYVYQDVPVPAELPANVGQCEWYNAALGIGMIRTNEGMARVHWSQIARPDERRGYLKPGEYVTFERLITPLNTMGRGTSFKLEAIMVDLVNDRTLVWLDLK